MCVCRAIEQFSCRNWIHKTTKREWEALSRERKKKLGSMKRQIFNRSMARQEHIIEFIYRIRNCWYFWRFRKFDSPSRWIQKRFPFYSLVFFPSLKHFDSVSVVSASLFNAEQPYPLQMLYSVCRCVCVCACFFLSYVYAGFSRAQLEQIERNLVSVSAIKNAIIKH